MLLALYIAGWFLLFVAASELFRRLPPKLSFWVWLVVSFAMIALWLPTAPRGEWFLWAKAFSVLLAVTWILALQAWPERIPLRIVAITLNLLLAVSIAEAILLDLSHGNTLNAIAGALLLPALAGYSAVTVHRGTRTEYLYDLGLPWIAAFTVWDLVFVYSNWNAIGFGTNIAVLGAAFFLGAAFGWERWFVFRAVTFGVYALGHDTFMRMMPSRYDTRHLWDEGIRDIAQVGALVVIAVILGFALLRRMRMAAKTRTQDGQATPA